MKLRRYYMRGVILPAIISISLTGILSIFDNYNYKSEWLTSDAVLFMSLLVAIFHSCIICMLSLTIFLNNKISKPGGIKTFLSWFLLPGAWILIVVYKTSIHRIYYEPETTEQLFYLITLFLPFVTGLLCTYIVFIKKLNHP